MCVTNPGLACWLSTARDKQCLNDPIASKRLSSYNLFLLSVSEISERCFRLILSWWAVGETVCFIWRILTVCSRGKGGRQPIFRARGLILRSAAWRRTSIKHYSYRVHTLTSEMNVLLHWLQNFSGSAPCTLPRCLWGALKRQIMLGKPARSEYSTMCNELRVCTQYT